MIQNDTQIVMGRKGELDYISSSYLILEKENARRVNLKLVKLG
jgi:hypothetical protein